MASNTTVKPIHGNLTDSLSTNLTGTAANQFADEMSQVNADNVRRKKNSLNPNWDAIKNREGVRLWEAVALLQNIKLSRLEKIKALQPTRHLHYRNRLKTAISWLNISLPIQQDHPENGIHSQDKVVLLSDFVQCAQSKGMKIPTGMMGILAQLHNEDMHVSKAKESGFSLPTSDENKLGRTAPKVEAESATLPAQVIAAKEPEVEIKRDLDGAPSMKKGKNDRTKVEEWVKWQACELCKPDDNLDGLAERIRLKANQWGYESERGPLSKPRIIKIIPAGTTGGRKKNGHK